MEVKDFVAQTIIEIVEGVKLAQEHGRQNGAVVNAPLTGLRGSVMGPPESQTIEFDILISVSDEAQTKSGLQVFFPPVRAGLHGADKAAMTTSNRVKFSITVAFPAQK